MTILNAMTIIIALLPWTSLLFLRLTWGRDPKTNNPPVDPIPESTPEPTWTLYPRSDPGLYPQSDPGIEHGIESDFAIRLRKLQQNVTDEELLQAVYEDYDRSWVTTERIGAVRVRDLWRIRAERRGIEGSLRDGPG